MCHFLCYFLNRGVVHNYIMVREIYKDIAGPVSIVNADACAQRNHLTLVAREHDRSQLDGVRVTLRATPREQDCGHLEIPLDTCIYLCIACYRKQATLPGG